MPPIEEMITTAPPPRPAMPGIARLHSQRLLLTLAPMILSKASSVSFASGPNTGLTAALQTRMSILPKAFSVPETSASTSERREMLQGMTIASPPRLRIPAATSSQGSSLRLETTTLAPSEAIVDALERPIVGVTNTFSDFNPCHGNVPQLLEAVKRGVMLAGGLPMEFPTISIHESFAYPTSMFLRNLMAMDTEEMIRALPVDSVVLIGGCDKTIPAQVMAAASADKPAIVLPVGPMLVGHFKGQALGA